MQLSAMKQQQLLTAGAAKEDLAAAVARTRREERLAADQRLTQSLQNQQQRLQQQHQQQLQEQLQRQQLQKQQSAVRRESSHLQLSLSESADFQALQQKLHEAVARCAVLPLNAPPVLPQASQTQAFVLPPMQPLNSTTPIFVFAVSEGVLAYLAFCLSAPRSTSLIFTTSQLPVHMFSTGL